MIESVPRKMDPLAIAEVFDVGEYSVTVSPLWGRLETGWYVHVLHGERYVHSSEHTEPEDCFRVAFETLAKLL